MAEELEPGKDAETPVHTAESPAAVAQEPGAGDAPPTKRWGAALLGLAVLAVVLTVIGVYAQTLGTPNHLPLALGLLLWGVLDLTAQRRGLVSWKGARTVVGNVVNLLRGLVLIGLGVWLGLMAAGVIRPINPAVIVWLGVSLLALYLAAALLLEVLVKGVRLSAQPFLLVALLLIFISYYYFAIPFTYSWAAVFAFLAFACSAWAVHKGVLSETPSLSLAVLLAVLLIGAPLAVYTYQQAFVVEEQPLFTPTLLIPRMRQVVGGLSEDAAQIKWSPVHTQPGQPGDVPFSDKVAFVDWDKDQQSVKLFQQHEDGLREILRVNTGGDALLTAFSLDGRRLAYTQSNKLGGPSRLEILEPLTAPAVAAALPIALAISRAASAATVTAAPQAVTIVAGTFLQRIERFFSPKGSAPPPPLFDGALAYGGRTLYKAGVAPGPEHGQVWRDLDNELYFAAPAGGPRNLSSTVLRADLKTDSIELLRKGRSLPAVSPDGKSLLSVGFAPNEKFLQIADGEVDEVNPRPFDPARETRYFPAWNVAQTKVLFLDKRTKRLMIMNSNGKNHMVFDPKTLDSKIWFSDKLQPFTLQWKESGDRFRVYRSQPDGSGEKLIYEVGAHDISAPQWSQDGQRVAFIVRRKKESEVVTVGSNGAWPRRFFITTDALDELKWSPDSGRVAFIVRRPENGTQELWTADVQGLDPERVLVDKGELKNLSWSPAGKHIAVQETTAWRLFGLRIIKPDIHNVLMVELSVAKARVMTRYGILASDPAFSPQGVAIAYFTDEHPWNPRPLRERTSALVISQLY